MNLRAREEKCMTGGPQLPLKLTEEQIEAGASERGGFTKGQVAKWGVPWPPPSGWRKALLDGRPIPKPDRSLPIRREGDGTYVTVPDLTTEELHRLLRQVVMVTINAGHAADLYAYPD